MCISMFAGCASISWEHKHCEFWTNDNISSRIGTLHTMHALKAHMLASWQCQNDNVNRLV